MLFYSKQQVGNNGTIRDACNSLDAYAGATKMTKPKRPYATNAKRRSVTITEPDWQKLKELGKGNASDGIRKAIQAASG